MNGRSFKSLRLLLPLGSLVFCVSLMAVPTPQSQDNQQTAPDNTKTDKDQAGPTANQQKTNSSDQALTQKIRKAIHEDQSLSNLRAQHQGHHTGWQRDTSWASAV